MRKHFIFYLTFSGLLFYFLTHFLPVKFSYWRTFSILILWMATFWFNIIFVNMISNAFFISICLYLAQQAVSQLSFNQPCLVWYSLHVYNCSRIINPAWYDALCKSITALESSLFFRFCFLPSVFNCIVMNECIWECQICWFVAVFVLARYDSCSHPSIGPR